MWIGIRRTFDKDGEQKREEGRRGEGEGRKEGGRENEKVAEGS